MESPHDAKLETSSSTAVSSESTDWAKDTAPTVHTSRTLEEPHETTDVSNSTHQATTDAAAIEDPAKQPVEEQETTKNPAETKPDTDIPDSMRQATGDQAEIQSEVETVPEEQRTGEGSVEALSLMETLDGTQDVTDASTETRQTVDAPTEMQGKTDVLEETQKISHTPIEKSQMGVAQAEARDTMVEPAETQPTTNASAEVQQARTTSTAETQPTGTIPLEPASSTSTSTSELKSSDSDIESNALNQQDEQEVWSSRLYGWRFWTINLALGLGIFLSQMETTIVSTSLVSITNDLNGFQSVSWIVTSYLVTYTGFLAIISKMSDIFGRKSLTLISFGLFIFFSLGCGLAQTMNQLIILRAFQGMGGGGIYAMAYVIFPDMSTPEMYGGYAAYLSLMAALACLLGPLLGGAINDHTTWRWVFWINVPIGLVATVLILIALPRNFPLPPHHSPLALPRQTLKQKLGRIDGAGTLLLLAASVLLVAALEEGGTAYSWTSAIPLACLIISFFLWISFVFWERFIHYQKGRTTVEATFPWPLMLERFTMGCLWNAFFVGGMFLVLAISIPQRLQVVHGDSPFTAGVRILPLTLTLPLGTILSGVIQSRFGVPPLYTFFMGGTIHTLGVSLLSTTTVTPLTAPFYVYQAITGFGLGISLATCIMTIPLVVAKENRAVAMGSIGQFRMLGGAVILAVFANVLNNPVSAQLAPFLTADQLSALLQSAASIELLPPELQAQVLSTYESGYQKQLRVLIAFSVGAILASLLLVERRPRRQTVQGTLA